MAEDADQPGPGVRHRGYTPSAKNFDALIFGYYEGDRLVYVARRTQWLHAKSLAAIVQAVRRAGDPKCPFVNLPEERPGRWGQGLTAEKMKECRWSKPVLVGSLSLWSGRPTIPSSWFARGKDG